MFRREPVHEFTSLSPRASHQNRPALANRNLRRIVLWQCCQLFCNFFLHAFPESPRRRNQKTPRIRRMFRLRQQIRRNPPGIPAIRQQPPPPSVPQAGRSRSPHSRSASPRSHSGFQDQKSSPRVESVSSRKPAQRSPEHLQRAQVSLRPSIPATANSSSFGRGQTAMIRRTPATCAGTTVIINVDTSANRPPGI